MSNKEIDDLSSILSQSGVAENNGILSFEGQGLKLNDEASAGKIVAAIEEFKELKVLELKGNTLGIEASMVIGRALQRHACFKRALWSDLFTGRLKSEIPEAVKNLCDGIIKSGARLVELDLSDNAFGPNGMTGLVHFLSSASCHSLKQLRLNNNGLGTTGGKMLATSLNTCYLSSTTPPGSHPLTLTTFVSGRGRLENVGARALSKPFKAMGSLQEVVMPQNGINHAGVKALAKAFAHNHALRILNLSDNTFTEIGSLAMAKTLQKLNNLEEINFEDCLVRTPGAVAIGNALKKSNPRLKVLKLSGNEIKVEGALVVVEAVVGKEGLECLELNANQLGESGIEKVKKALEKGDKEDVLGSFSDDEGSEDDDDEDDDPAKYCVDSDGDGDEEETDDGDEETDDGCDDDDRAAGDVCVDAEKVDEGHDTIELFLNNPTIASFNQLLHKDKAFMHNYLEDKMGQLDFATMSLIKLSALCHIGGDQINKEIFDIADTFLSKVFEEISFSWIVNSILISLGLLKDEQKKVFSPPNLNGALLLLTHTCTQPYFNSDARHILKDFIDMNVDKLPCEKKILTTLLKSLS